MEVVVMSFLLRMLGRGGIEEEWKEKREKTRKESVCKSWSLQSYFWRCWNART